MGNGRGEAEEDGAAEEEGGDAAEIHYLLFVGCRMDGIGIMVDAFYV